MSLDKTKELVNCFGGWAMLIITAVTFSTIIINMSNAVSRRVSSSTTSFCMTKTNDVHEYKKCIEILTK